MVQIDTELQGASGVEAYDCQTRGLLNQIKVEVIRNNRPPHQALEAGQTRQQRIRATLRRLRPGVQKTASLM